MLDVLIQNAQVIDGLGGPGYRGNVGIRDGLITLDTKNESAKRTINADGLVVAPGFIDLHTHYDVQLMWDGSASPSTLHGVTTVMGGNCGFSIAPLREDTADYHMRMMSVVEGMPLESLRAGPSWNWTSFDEWLGRFEKRIAVNAGFLVGHSALRLAVMGAAAVGEKANERQVREMQRLLATCLEAGGLGFSSTQKTVHLDGDGNHVPSYSASREELYALSEVLQRFPGTSLEFAGDGLGRHLHPTEDIEIMTEMSRRAGRPINWNTMRVRPRDRGFVEEQMRATDVSVSRGGRIVGMTNPKPFSIRVSFASGMPFNGLPGWASTFTLDMEARKRALGVAEVRSHLRHAENATLRDTQRFIVNWATYEVTEGFNEQTKRLEGRTIGELARERGREPFDTLLDIAIEDNLRTFFRIPEEDDSMEAWRERARVWLDPRTIVGGADAGAHLDQICGTTYTTVLLGDQVRKRQLLSLEEAVRQLTDVPSRFYGLTGRGRIAEGFHADLVVFDAQTIGAGPELMRSDMPGGGARLYADASGIEHVFVNGGEIVRANQATGASPGRVLRSGRDATAVNV